MHQHDMYGVTEIFANRVLESFKPATMACSMKRCLLIFFFFVLISHLDCFFFFDCFLTGEFYTFISTEIEPWFMLHSLGNFLYFRHICLTSKLPLREKSLIPFSSPVSVLHQQRRGGWRSGMWCLWSHDLDK